MDVVKIVTQIRDLALDPNNRVTIVRDQGCLPGLVLFLDNEDASVITLALEALTYLSQCEDNKGAMRDELGLTISLKDIIKQERYSTEIQETAMAVLDSLQEEPQSPTVEHADDADRRQPLSALQTPNHSIFRNNINKKARTITLQIDGLDDLNAKEVVEDILLGVKGVVSFTFNMKDARVVVRARTEVQVEDLCRIITATEHAQLAAKQIVKNEQGQEVVLSFGTSPSSVGKENASAEPQYLDDDDLIEDPTAFQKAVARVGGGANNAGGWLNSAVGYLAQNLYW